MYNPDSGKSSNEQAGPGSSSSPTSGPSSAASRAPELSRLAERIRELEGPLIEGKEQAELEYRRQQLKEGAKQTDAQDEVQCIYRAVKEIESVRGCCPISYYEANANPDTSNAPVLRYVATLMANIANEASHNSRCVAAAALVNLDDGWRFVVSLNGHTRLDVSPFGHGALGATLLDRIPSEIGGIPVDVIMDDAHLRLDLRQVSVGLGTREKFDLWEREQLLQHELAGRKVARGPKPANLGDRQPVSSRDLEPAKTYGADGKPIKTYVIRDGNKAVSKTLEPLRASTVWDWHAEQKLLRGLKTLYGPTVRSSVTEIGISKVPCRARTHGTNYCDDYLYRKYLRYASGDTDRCVSAHFYKHTDWGIDLAPECTVTALRRAGVAVAGDGSEVGPSSGPSAKKPQVANRKQRTARRGQPSNTRRRDRPG